MNIVTDFAFGNKTQSDVRTTVATRIKLATVAFALALAVTAAPMIASTMVEGEVVGVNVAQAGGCKDSSGC